MNLHLRNGTLFKSRTSIVVCVSELCNKYNLVSNLTDANYMDTKSTEVVPLTPYVVFVVNVVNSALSFISEVS